jgi:hypothetical protein
MSLWLFRAAADAAHVAHKAGTSASSSTMPLCPAFADCTSGSWDACGGRAAFFPVFGCVCGVSRNNSTCGVGASQ